MTRRKRKDAYSDHAATPISHRPHSAGYVEVAIAERRIRALRMRNQGYGLEHIAQECEVSISTSKRDITEALRTMVRLPIEDMVANHRAIVADIIKSNYPAMLVGDDKAASVMLKTLDHEAKLFGLYAPARVNVGVNDEEFSKTVANLLREIGVDNLTDVPRMIEGTVEAEVFDDAADGVVPLGDSPDPEPPLPDDWAGSPTDVPEEWID